ncbi:aminotransferase class IV [Campylobacter majalis]|uniref:aminotransferase class IV n=1 Tax=Campylobacter majalis TaxID=2790656 RepID=UPI003D69022A
MSSQRKFTFLFETIKLVNGEVFHLSYHLRRMLNSLGFVPKFNLKQVLKTDKKGLVRAKVIYHKSGELVKVEFFEYKMREFSEFKLVDIDFSYDKKYLIRDDIDAAKGKNNEIIMIKNGLITDTSIANIAVFDGEWLTPKDPLLNGTTRTRLINEGMLKECDIDVNMLMNAKKFAIMNAMIDFFEIKNFKFIL